MRHGRRPYGHVFQTVLQYVFTVLRKQNEKKHQYGCRRSGIIEKKKKIYLLYNNTVVSKTGNTLKRHWYILRVHWIIRYLSNTDTYGRNPTLRFTKTQTWLQMFRTLYRRGNNNHSGLLNQIGDVYIYPVRIWLKTGKVNQGYSFRLVIINYKI